MRATQKAVALFKVREIKGGRGFAEKKIKREDIQEYFILALRVLQENQKKNDQFSEKLEPGGSL